MQLLTPLHLTYYLIAINFVTFAAFAFDKARAESSKRRVSEFRLLQFAFLGGTPAAYAARAFFRHKTRKQPFSGRLHTIAALQLCGAVFLIAYFA